ncbi:hypothetical protein [Streptomyces sp. NPDC088196]|uniref:hypothetical protein n=1 Tax=Streptomyces sp. NPDC088196 TaxID=3154868 RepID=UPI00344BD57A
MAALLSLFMMIPTMGSAHADALCDTTCIYNQLVSGGLKAAIPPQTTFSSDKSIRYYTGPNGLEIRYGRDATWHAITTTGELAANTVAWLITGGGASVADLIVAPLKKPGLVFAAQTLGIGLNSQLGSIAQDALQRDYCLGVTIPPNSVGPTMLRAEELALSGYLAGFVPDVPGDVKVWFEPCSNERAAGQADTVTQPIGIMSGNLQEETSAKAIPITGGSASTMTSLGRDVLLPGQKMYPNQYLTSLDGRFVLALQNDGNLVAYGPGYVPIWSSGTSGRSVDCLLVQGDGNVVLYGGNNSGPIWATNTSGGASLKIQEDGNVVVYNSSGVSQWRTGTTRATTGGTYDNSFQLTDGQWLRPGHYLRSGDFRYTLYMQNDGNLVYWAPGGRILWTSGTGGHPNIEGAFMQSDGNLVLYAQGAIWATHTGGAGPHKLLLQNDGNMVLYGGNGATWSTGTGGKI